MMTKKPQSNWVDHPKHYGGEDNPYEAIKVIESWDLNFNLGISIANNFKNQSSSQISFGYNF